MGGLNEAYMKKDTGAMFKGAILLLGADQDEGIGGSEGGCLPNVDFFHGKNPSFHRFCFSTAQLTFADKIIILSLKITSSTQNILT